MPPAINRDRLAGDPCGFRRSEKETEFGDFFGLAWTSEWMRPTRSFEERGVILVVHPATPMEIRDYDAGVHGVHAHTARCEFERGAPRQLIDRGLADAICKDARKRAKACHARHVHD